MRRPGTWGAVRMSNGVIDGARGATLMIKFARLTRRHGDFHLGGPGVAIGAYRPPPPTVSTDYPGDDFTLLGCERPGAVRSEIFGCHNVCSRIKLLQATPGRASLPFLDAGTDGHGREVLHAQFDRFCGSSPPGLAGKPSDCRFLEKRPRAARASVLVSGIQLDLRASGEIGDDARIEFCRS